MDVLKEKANGTIHMEKEDIVSVQDGESLVFWGRSCLPNSPPRS